MKKNIYTLTVIFGLLLSAQTMMAKTYVVPPSSTTSSSVPVISDEDMRACIILYNEAKDLKLEISTMAVDRYSQLSVDNYNNKVLRHSQMINKFNQNCAGRQSESAHKEAQKLNEESRGI